jgi:ribosomal protein L7/L12
LRERADEKPAGAWETILWRVGGDRVAVMRAVREITRCGLGDAKAMLEDLPCVVLTGVRVDVAHEAAALLTAAGAEATADRPKR